MEGLVNPVYNIYLKYHWSMAIHFENIICSWKLRSIHICPNVSKIIAKWLSKRTVLVLLALHLTSCRSVYSSVATCNEIKPTKHRRRLFCILSLYLCVNYIKVIYQPIFPRVVFWVQYLYHVFCKIASGCALHGCVSASEQPCRFNT